MNVEVQVLKGIPEEQIEKFTDRVVYNTAVLTREMAKNIQAYPVKTGTLMREEVAQEIIGKDKEYGLGAGTSYAKYVWKMENVNWTNKRTQPHWYYSVYNKFGATITTQAVVKTLKGLK